MNNDRGYVMAVVLMVLVILTIIVSAGLRSADMGMHSVTNTLIYEQNFNAAEGGMFYGAEWAAGVSNAVWENKTSDGSGTFKNGSSYTFDVEYRKDGAGQVLTYTDTVSGAVLPQLLIAGIGNHVRGGNAVVTGVYVMRPIFFMPQTPIWVFDSIKVQGNVNVNADASTGSLTHDEVAFTLTPTLPYSLPNKMNCPGGCDYNTAPNPFPTDDVRIRVKDSADYSGSVFPTALVSKSSLTNPVVVYINGDVTLNNSTIIKNANTGNQEGFGILFIDGSAKINGNIKWNGLVVIRDSASVGNGTADIEGALIAGHNTIPGQPSDGIIDVTLSGTIDIAYNRTLLMNLWNKTARPVMLSWYN